MTEQLPPGPREGRGGSHQYYEGPLERVPDE